MGFAFAGNLGGSAPVVRNFQIGETLYTGYLLQSGLVGGAGGGVQILEAPAKAHEDDHPVLGLATGVHVIDDAGWNSTYKGDTATYDVGVAAQKANDPVGACHVETTLIQPDMTLVRAPIYNGAYGTSLSECAISTADATGLSIDFAATTITGTADDLGVVYCRSGASRGHYRVVTTTGTVENTVTIAFPYGTAVGDIYVNASCVFGLGGLMTPAAPNCIDGDDALTNYYDVYYHDINLEEAGKEFALLAFKSGACGGVGYLGT